jgi:protein subunit release factor A
MDSKIEEWKRLEYTGSIKEEKEFLTVIKKELENENKKSDEIEIELSKIKSKILDKDSINSEKNKIIKKIEDYKKQISQLENNLTFVSEKSDTSIFSNVHSNIDSFKREIEKLEKNLNLISKS